MQLFYERYPVGEIIVGKSNARVFRYDPAWLAQGGAFPLSTTMLLRPESWGWPVLAPWLINLRPEDNDAIRMMARILDVPHTDVLALLGRVGRDTSGAIPLPNAVRPAVTCERLLRTRTSNGSSTSFRESRSLQAKTGYPCRSPGCRANWPCAC